ncbi:GNAT family N-acetyltransferase [Anaeromicropila herbilytica]|uniref:N-acetyltransferase domain-containing protein n=1 Tax=Anaeromicropila herbilytica TaxID=2785025 RepID=A0A7R7ELR9_9FIRM|nr:GNAT family N-acetyltransferase [Anaeromicropila herbilytica]BCN30842.1 hypothetical protein bsdtb5_21370 [Anaeromicropila herbilytica]
MIIEQLKDNIDIIKPLIDNYKNSIHEDKLTAVQLESLSVAISLEDIVFFVAKIEDTAVAMCSVTRTFSTFSCSYSGVFEDFYIIPEYRKKGLAKKMTTYIFDYCKQNSISSLWVGCADCDVEMYKHLGFEIPLGNLRTWSVD